MTGERQSAYAARIEAHAAQMRMRSRCKRRKIPAAPVIHKPNPRHIRLTAAEKQRRWLTGIEEVLPRPPVSAALLCIEAAYLFGGI